MLERLKRNVPCEPVKDAADLGTMIQGAWELATSDAPCADDIRPYVIPKVKLMNHYTKQSYGNIISILKSNAPAPGKNAKARGNTPLVGSSRQWIKSHLVS